MSDPNPLIQDLRHHQNPEGLVIVSNSMLLAAASAIEEAEARAALAEAENERLRAQIAELVARSVGNLNKLQEILHAPRGVVE